MVLLDHGLYVELPEQLRQVWQPATTLRLSAMPPCTLYHSMIAEWSS